MLHRTIRGCLLSAVIAGGLLATNGVAANAAGTVHAPLTILTNHASPSPTGTASSVIQPFGSTTAAASRAAAPALTSTSTPKTLAITGVNTGLLAVGLLFLAFGGLLALILGRKRR